MTTKNPWLGIASYEEPKNESIDYLFCGRDEETIDVLRLIDNNLFITLYGCSGIGKTSLLRAGVIPILRKKGYFPLYVRLSQEPKEISYAETIVRKLQSSGLIEKSSVAMKYLDGNNRLYLWNYFATTRFLKDDREVYPVIILDQFEEVFREGDKAKAELLLKQIYLLLNDELEMPDEEGYSADTNYRFVASIREDFLFVLEDSIDAYALELYKNNRYRLRPMKPEQARQVVLVPGKDSIKETEKEAIVERVISLAKRPQSDAIDTLLLSLICAGTYDKKAEGKISFGDLSVWRNNPMEVYYQEAIKGLTADQVRYIQQHLIREDGSRKRMDADEVKAALGETTYRQLTQGKNRLLSIGDKGQVELLHDQLGIAIYEERKAFEERERKRKLRRRVSVIGIFVLAIAGVFWFQNAKLKQQRWEMMENQSRLVAKEVIANAKNDSYLARIIALKYLLSDGNNNNERVIPEFESALRIATTYNSAVFIGHTAAITSTCFSPDGKYVLSSSFDNTIRLWDASNGLCLKTFYGHTDRVYKAVFCPDLSKIASCSKDNTVRIWDMKSLKSINTLFGHEDGVFSVAFSPDGKHVLSSSEDKTIRIWDVETGECINVLKGHEKMVECALYSPTGDMIASCSEDSTIKLWDANSEICTKTLLGHKGAVQSVEFSPDGQYIVSASRDSTVKIWNAESGQCIRALTGHSAGVQYASFSDNGKLIASSSDDATTRIWEVSSGNCIDILKGHTIYATSPHFSPDSKRIVTGSVDWTVRIWDIGIKNNGKQFDIQSVNRKPCFSSDGLQIAFISNDSILVYNVSSGKKLNSIKNNKNGYVDVCYDTNGGFYAVSVNLDTILIWNSKSNNWDAKSIDTGEITAIALCPEKKQIAIALDDGLITFLDIVTGNKTKTLKAQSVNGISFSFDGNNIISTSNDGIIRVYDINKSNCLCELNTQNTAKNNVIMNHSKTEVVTCNNNVVYVWDMKTGKAIRSFIGHTAKIYGYTLSNDDRYLITVSHDNTIKIWDYKSGVCVQSIIDEQHEFVSYSPDERHFATVSLDYGTIKIWDFPPLQDLIDQTRERFKDRPLTDEERKMYYLE